jgi:predicted aspartyl protease
MLPGHALTILASGRQRVLVTPVKVGAAFDPRNQIPTFRDYTGIWDTGATASVITQKVVDECGLKQISIDEAYGADGKYLTEVFLVCVQLPNGVGFSSLRVTKGKLVGGFDMLIGMDIIGSGDFAVTNYQGQTCLTFRSPSVERIDFTGKVPQPLATSTTTPPMPISAIPKVGRNDPCPCGSGKKYKKCCAGTNPPKPH